MKEVKIDIPEGYEIDKENSTFECIKFKKKGSLSYEYIQNLARGGSPYRSNIYCCLRHIDKLTVYRMLLEVAECLNKGWEPNWKDFSQIKYFINGYYDNTYIVDYCVLPSGSSVYFKSSEITKQAIEIVGEKYLDILFK